MAANENLASLGGQSVRELVLTIPQFGRWTADCRLDHPQGALSGVQTLRLAGFSFVGTVVRGGDFVGTGYYRIVGGYGGWGRVIGPRGYSIQASGGVTVAMVVKDAATACGERYAVLRGNDRSLGNHWVRLKGPASRVFGQMGVKNWWVRSDGVTVVGNRESPVVASAFDVLPESNLGVGRVEIATDYPGDWQPSVQFTAPTLATQRTVSAVVHTLTPDRLRTTAWII